MWEGQKDNVIDNRANLILKLAQKLHLEVSELVIICKSEIYKWREDFMRKFHLWSPTKKEDLCQKSLLSKLIKGFHE